MIDLYVGQLVRIKEIPGTKLASKRKPLWGQITACWAEGYDPDNAWARVVIFSGPEHHNAKLLRERNFDIPTDKQVPDWVWAEIAKRELLK